MTHASVNPSTARIDASVQPRHEHPTPKRLSRKVLMSGALAFGLVIAFALLSGLSPRNRAAAYEADDTSVPTASAMPEGLSALPTRYGATMLQADAEPLEPRDMMWGENGPPGGFDPYGIEDPSAPEFADDPYWTEGASGYGAGPAAPGETANKDEPEPVSLFFEPRRTPQAGSGRGKDDASFQANDGVSSASVNDAREGDAASDVLPPRSPFAIHAGTVIPAALLTAVNSDLPGSVVAQVTSPVYDSATGDHLLIPQGARLIGTYSSKTLYGDTRVFLAWNRLILPDGSSISLGEMNATDPSGAAGLPAKVDNHLDRIGGAIAISAVLSILANEAENDDDEGFGRSLGDAAAQEAARTGSRIVDRELNLRPTLKAPAGAPVRVLVTNDLSLQRYTE
jgi:type IV secretion system protein TrbI